MIETINDFLSVFLILLIVLTSFYYIFSLFSKHHAERIMELESEYYDYADDEIDEETYI